MGRLIGIKISIKGKLRENSCTTNIQLRMPLMLTTSIDQLSQNLQHLLIEDANRLGRESGFIQRERKWSGASFAQSLVFGWQANPEASLEELCQSARVCGVQISPQGLQERLNSPQANAFLHQLLIRGIDYLVHVESERKDLLSSFNGVYIQDSSKIELPTSLHRLWQGNQRRQATLKVHTVLDYQHGGFDLSLVSGRVHDCPLQTVALPSGSLRLADLAYFKVAILEQLNTQQVWWVSRLPARAGIWNEDQVVHAADWLSQFAGKSVDVAVELTAQRFPCRIIALPVPPQVAQERRQRVRVAAKKRSPSQLKPETLALCDWTLLVTNLPSEHFSAQDIVCLQRLRWQIELLFKLWKTELSMTRWRTQQPHQILSEVYAKLLLALIQHWFLLLGCWQLENRSLVKACRVLRKNAFFLLTALPCLAQLTRALQLVLSSLSRCVIAKRKARPATFQLLARAFP
jgi:hypothetical protein